MPEPILLDEFLEKKHDFSPFLVHLTRDSDEVPARDVLKTILDENTLRAYNHFCYFSTALKKSENVPLESKFRVVCFTETPIGQIDVLLIPVAERKFKPEHYGLVFKKSYIREKGGNPVFYVTRQIAKPIYYLLYEAHIVGKEQAPEQLCKLLALVSLCEEGNDWHWEREWRVVGDLEFDLNDIYCGLCPEGEISYFENRYAPVKFISPYWGINKILDKLVGK
jgi:hypothetical protein